MATAQEVKSSYRRLARQWHPDVNPNNQHAHDMFIRVTEAYKVLLSVAPSGSASIPHKSPAQTATNTGRTTPTPNQGAAASQSNPYRSQPPSRQAAPQSPNRQSSANASSYYRQAAASQSSQASPNSTGSSDRPDPSYEIKLRAYEQLQDFLKMKRYPRAIALIEALNQKLPQDAEIRQWQAIIYQRWGRQLIADRKYNQARAYLKKAYTTDPNNKSLLAEIERDLKAIKMSV